MTCNFDLQQYVKQIRNIITWVDHSVGDEPITLDEEQFSHASETERMLFVNKAFERMSEFAANQTMPDVETCLERYKSGSLLIFYPDITLWDGTAQTVAGGFFAYDNTPPPHTWLYYSPETEKPNIIAHLLSWVPPNRLDGVTDAMGTCPGKSLSFLSDIKSQTCYQQTLVDNHLLI